MYSLKHFRKTTNIDESRLKERFNSNSSTEDVLSAHQSRNHLSSEYRLRALSKPNLTLFNPYNDSNDQLTSELNIVEFERLDETRNLHDSSKSYVDINNRAIKPITKSFGILTP